MSPANGIIRGMRKTCIVVAAVFAVAVCAGESCPDPLSLWTDGAPAKTALVEYVESVTREGSPDFIPEESRIAVFDLDGTLMLETAPTYFDWIMFLERVLDDPTCHTTPASSMMRRNLPISSAAASEVSPLPRAPVYLVSTTPPLSLP